MVGLAAHLLCILQYSLSSFPEVPVLRPFHDFYEINLSGRTCHCLAVESD